MRGLGRGDNGGGDRERETRRVKGEGRKERREGGRAGLIYASGDGEGLEGGGGG